MSTTHYHTCDHCLTTDDPRYEQRRATSPRAWVLEEGDQLVPAQPTAIVIPGDFCPESVAAIRAYATPTQAERDRRNERARAARKAAEAYIASAPADIDPEWVFDLFDLAGETPSYEMRKALGDRLQAAKADDLGERGEYDDEPTTV